MGLRKDDNINLYSRYPAGPGNRITDVAGVKVGNVTIQSEDHNVNTGVTAVIPAGGNLYREKLVAGASVINGYGKSVGLIQINELGTLEAPVFITNTLSVGTVLSASVKHMLEENPEIGVTTMTVNCVVCECNDGELNDIRGMHVTEKDALDALKAADVEFEEGAVGAGTGMRMMSLKGGVGTASRLIDIAGTTYTIGALAVTNYGTEHSLIMGGEHVGWKLSHEEPCEDKGSCIMIIATDIPLSSRQLTRMAARSAHALARTGSYSGNYSGDIGIAFSTANRISHFTQEPFSSTGWASGYSAMIFASTRARGSPDMVAAKESASMRPSAYMAWMYSMASRKPSCIAVLMTLPSFTPRWA